MPLLLSTGPAGEPARRGRGRPRKAAATSKVVKKAVFHRATGSQGSRAKADTSSGTSTPGSASSPVAAADALLQLASPSTELSAPTAVPRPSLSPLICLEGPTTSSAGVSPPTSSGLGPMAVVYIGEANQGLLDIQIPKEEVLADCESELDQL